MKNPIGWKNVRFCMPVHDEAREFNGVRYYDIPINRSSPGR